MNGGGTYSGALTTTTNDESVVRRLVATSLTATWHLHFVLEKKKGGEMSWLTPARHRLCLFVGAGHRF